MQSFRNFFFLILVSFCFFGEAAYAKQSFVFGANQDVQILSDKAYRKTLDNTYEAHGNVIIKLRKDAIYGEKASLSFSTGVGKVWGNVRYVGPVFTLYGTEIAYELKEKTFTVKNAKLVDENFVILGKEIKRFADGHFEATEAEYSTCKDCPESWSIQGMDVKVIPNQYIYLKHAFLKVRGVIVVYIPYLVLPIKKDRETGLLFPKIGFNLDEGFYFQQPFFWAIDQSKDLTISPTIYGQRAYGGEWEYRQAINNYSHLNLFNMQARDRIWEPEKINDDLTSERSLRQYYDYDTFYNFNNKTSVYSNGKFLSDLDIQADYDLYLKDRLIDNESGYRFGLQHIFSNFYIGLDSHFKNYSLYENAKGFDHQYVQTLPRVELGHSQISLYDNNFSFLPISKISFWQYLSFDYFKQNHVEENEYIRNIQRYDYTPTVKMFFKPIGPVNISTEYQLDYQHYHMPFETEAQTARKYGSSLKTSFSFEVEKQFGRAYIRKTKEKPVIKATSSGDLITEVPTLGSRVVEKSEVISSYKHLVNYSVNHQYYKKQKFSGSEKLEDQFLDGSTKTRFDYRDLVRGFDQNLFDASTRTDLPESNTVEFKILNSLLRKTPRQNSDPFTNFKYQLDNFDYSKVAYFDISQGIILDDKKGEETTFNDRLTRLATTFGFSVGRLSLSASEYYFHQGGDHITTINLRHRLRYFTSKLEYVYDSFSEERRYSKLDFTFKPSGLVALRMGHFYDFETSRVYESYIGGNYKPLNNCWIFDLEYRQKDAIENNELVKDKIISLNFLLNYNSKNFSPILGLEL